MEYRVGMKHYPNQPLMARQRLEAKLQGLLCVGCTTHKAQQSRNKVVHFHIQTQKDRKTHHAEPMGEVSRFGKEDIVTWNAQGFVGRDVWMQQPEAQAQA